jgi:hypothetical protein
MSAAGALVGPQEALNLRDQGVIMLAGAIEPCATLLGGAADRVVEKLVQALPPGGVHGV